MSRQVTDAVGAALDLYAIALRSEVVANDRYRERRWRLSDADEIATAADALTLARTALKEARAELDRLLLEGETE